MPETIPEYNAFCCSNLSKMAENKIVVDMATFMEEGQLQRDDCPASSLFSQPKIYVFLCLLRLISTGIRKKQALTMNRRFIAVVLSKSDANGESEA